MSSGKFDVVLERDSDDNFRTKFTVIGSTRVSRLEDEWLKKLRRNRIEADKVDVCFDGRKLDPQTTMSQARVVSGSILVARRERCLCDSSDEEVSLSKSTSATLLHGCFQVDDAHALAQPPRKRPPEVCLDSSDDEENSEMAHKRSKLEVAGRHSEQNAKEGSPQTANARAEEFQVAKWVVAKAKAEKATAIAEAAAAAAAKEEALAKAEAAAKAEVEVSIQMRALRKAEEAVKAEADAKVRKAAEAEAAAKAETAKKVKEIEQLKTKIQDEVKQATTKVTESFEEKEECSICMAGKKCAVVLPCKHLCLCATCAGTFPAELSLCPICRATILDTMVIYNT
jgi:hypothetical protein